MRGRQLLATAMLVAIGAPPAVAQVTLPKPPCLEVGAINVELFELTDPKALGIDGTVVGSLGDRPARYYDPGSGFRVSTISTRDGEAWGVSQTGFVVGSRDFGSAGVCNRDPFRFDPSNFAIQNLHQGAPVDDGNFCGAADLGARAISDDGNVIVGQTLDRTANLKGAEAFRWTPGGGVEPLGFLMNPGNASSRSDALDVSPDGSTIVGWSTNREDVVGSDGTVGNFGVKTAFRKRGTGPMEPLPTRPEPCYVKFGSGLPAEISCVSEATSVSRNGSVIAGWVHVGYLALQTPLNPVRNIETPAVWIDGVLQEIGALGNPNPDNQPTGSGRAVAVSDDGTYVVGKSTVDGSFTQIPFIWDAENGARPLTDFLALNGFTAEVLAGQGLEAILSVTDVRSLPGGGLRIIGRGQEVDGPVVSYRISIDCPDADGDRLCDPWERAGGIDLNGDGEITPCNFGDCPDLVLADADLTRKDVYVEIDTLTATAALQSEALDAVRNAFAVVPGSLVGNTPGTQGMKLHLELDESDLTLSDGTLVWQADACTGAGPRTASQQWVNTVRMYFGTPAERSNLDVLEAKGLLYRHGIYGGTHECVGGEGVYNYFWFADTAQERISPQASVAEVQAGVLMHELGHTLNLEHGGPDDVKNWKPNYHSVMNYLWTVPFGGLNLKGLLANQSWILDYSRREFRSLSEGADAIDELAGVGGHLFHWVPMGPVLPDASGQPASILRRELGPEDFDGDGVLEIDPVGPVDLNVDLLALARAVRNGTPYQGTADESFAPKDDWSFIGTDLCPNYSAFGIFTNDPEGVDEVQVPNELPFFSPDIDALNFFLDCNGNGVDDDTDLAEGVDFDANGNGLLDSCDPLIGDVDLDEDVDATDRDLLMASFGLGEGEEGYNGMADLDDDRWVTFVDYQLWLASYDEFQKGGSVGGTTSVVDGSCGLLGMEALVPLAGWAWARRRKQRRSLNA